MERWQAEEEVEKAAKLKAEIRQQEIEMENDYLQMYGFYVKPTPFVVANSQAHQFSFRN